MSTIAAISTPPGKGGIAVVRISGPEAHAIAAKHVSLPSCGPQHQAVGYSLFRHEGHVVDEVMVTRYNAPHSYTGEDTIEIACHGSSYVQQAILQALIKSGAIMAAPGEFTQRAFLNGRIDLSQAEAVADLIDSTNAATHQLALSQMRGGYFHRLQQLRQQFVELTALLELELDFSEEDVEFADRKQLLSIVDTIDTECQRLCKSFHLGNAIKNGIPVAIVGLPNAGKSTLLNALLGEERAIVSDIPGTTRDTIEDTLNIHGITYRFIDTAGIRNSDDQIESLGIQRSYQTIEKAQVVLYLSENPDTLSLEINELSSHISLEGKLLIPILTKCDQIQPEGESNSSPASTPEGTLSISALTGQGINQLHQKLAVHYDVNSTQDPILTNLRHFEALEKVIASLSLVRQGLADSIPADLVVIDLREALYHLGTITGEVTSNEVLGNIFHRFCIGK